MLLLIGAPIKNEDDAIRAVKTAIEMKTKLEEFNSKHTDLSKPLEIRMNRQDNHKFSPTFPTLKINSSSMFMNNFSTDIQSQTSALSYINYSSLIWFPSHQSRLLLATITKNTQLTDWEKFSPVYEVYRCKIFDKKCSRRIKALDSEIIFIVKNDWFTITNLVCQIRIRKRKRSDS